MPANRAIMDSTKATMESSSGMKSGHVLSLQEPNTPIAREVLRVADYVCVLV